ncbi:hypothetical protein BGP79_15665 [Tersicoccus sp. Bi-70]|nr:hypothetical protein BGP79_15665 [Tersicoccus sp. Bi-70]
MGKQSPAELRRIERSGQPAQLLTDEHGKTIAGYIEEPKITPYLSHRGPGCALTDACATSSNGTPNGFYGTGSLN